MEDGGALVQGNPNNHGSFGYSRVKLPQFGGDDLRGWIYRCENYFDYEETAEDSKVKIATINLEGRAQHWHQTMVHTQVGRGLPNL